MDRPGLYHQDEAHGSCSSPTACVNHIGVFDVSAAAHLGNAREFTVCSQGALRDGFRLDATGRIRAAAGDGVHCFDPRQHTPGQDPRTAGSRIERGVRRTEAQPHVHLRDDGRLLNPTPNINAPGSEARFRTQLPIVGRSRSWQAGTCGWARLLSATTTVTGTSHQRFLDRIAGYERYADRDAPRASVRSIRLSPRPRAVGVDSLRMRSISAGTANTA